MSCVTPADLGKPVAAIVERCGPPLGVNSVQAENELFYVDGDYGTMVVFDADQMRVRVLQFSTLPSTPADVVVWNLTLPFQSGARTIALGRLTLAEAQSTLAADADVTTDYGAAFHSTPRNDIVLAGSKTNRIMRIAFIGERASLVQSGLIATLIGDAPISYEPPVPLDAWITAGSKGPQTTIFRIDVDASGIARKVTIVVPSRDAAFDAATQARLGDAKFRAARVDSRPVSGTNFMQVRH
jgi:hypothetical protein